MDERNTAQHTHTQTNTRANTHTKVWSKVWCAHAHGQALDLKCLGQKGLVHLMAPQLLPTFGVGGWALGFGVWVLGFNVLGLGFGFWVLDFGLTEFRV